MSRSRGTGLLRRVAQLLSAVRAKRTVAVHLHGVTDPLGLYASRLKGMPQSLSLSPGGSGSLPPIGTTPPQRQAKEELASTDTSVDPAFFAVARHEAHRPLLVAGSRTHNPAAVALFAQLAVLLSEESLDVSCIWHGSADADSLARLAAANVEVCDLPDVPERAAQLAAAWIYVAFDGTRGFALDLAEALAAGVPCVAWSTAEHRSLVDPGRTALCCQSHQQLLACVAELIDSPSERDRLGRAAREQALCRLDAQGPENDPERPD